MNQETPAQATLPANGLVPLTQLPPHTCATVGKIDAQSDDIDRLKSMGVCAGRKVEVVLRGDPLILRVFGTRIGLSARLAEQIYASTCHEPDCPVQH